MEIRESDTRKTKKMSRESSIFSSILADIEENPTILQKRQMKLSEELSVFSTILADSDEESPTILQNTNKKVKKTRRRESMKTPLDFTCTVSQTLTHSDLVHTLNEEVKIVRSETEINGHTSDDRFVSCNPDHNRERDCVEEGKVEQLEEDKFRVDEAIEWLLRDVKESEISTDTEVSVCNVGDGDILEIFDEMLSAMLGEQVNGTDGCGRIDECIDKVLEEIERDGSYLHYIKDGYVFGGLLENLIRDRLREKAEKEEKEISSWISNGESEVETGVTEEVKEEEKDIKEKKKMTPVVVKIERADQESTVTKHDCLEYKRRLYMNEKLRERHKELMQRRRKAVRFGVELSFLVAELMFLIPNEILCGGTGDCSMFTKLFGVNEDDEGTSVIIRKLEAVFEIVIWKKGNKEHDVNLPESIFQYDDFIRLCADATRVLGKIVWAMKRDQCERLELSDLDSLFEDCQKVLMKIELKLAEMKQRVYRSVSADYESFSKSERSDRLLKEKLMKRVIADNRFGRSVIGSYLVEIWQSLFQAEALHEQ
ncbi:uncharacterized protein LOC17880846 [Capsella rubella]|nr:uncharacterized protein LOC17880846 [Capsella rubella]